ncbi:hypothetical protein ACXR0O_05010 [Verrucomicrobiota bacterium sgz303538]
MTGRRLLIIIASIALLAVKFGWRTYLRHETDDQAMLDQFVPAMRSMSPEVLNDSEWAYTGPLGNLTLYFEPDGKLTATSDADSKEGRWEIRNTMLIAHIPGANSPHEGIFRTSTDEMAGVSPAGMQPPKWSATRSK